TLPPNPADSPSGCNVPRGTFPLRGVHTFFRIPGFSYRSGIARDFCVFLNNLMFVSLPLWQRQSFTLMDQRLCLWNSPGPSRALDPDLPTSVPARQSSAGDTLRLRLKFIVAEK